MLPMDFCRVAARPPSGSTARMALLDAGRDGRPGRQAAPVDCRAASSSASPSHAPSRTIPPLLVADEPTGNLDSATADAVFRLFGRLVDEGKTVVMVTHDIDLAALTRRTIHMVDGRIVPEEVWAASHPTPMEMRPRKVAVASGTVAGG